MWVLLFSVLSAAASKTVIDLQVWAAQEHFKVFVEDSSGRIVVERPHLPPLILQVGNGLALENDSVWRFEAAPEKIQGRVLLPKSMAVAFSPVVKPPLKNEPAKSVAIVQPPPVLATSTSAPNPKPKQEVVAAPKPEPLVKNNSSENLARIPCALNRKIQRIFLDPGHGGHDFGTQKQGIKEKAIALAFAQSVARELKLAGFETSLSRTRDVFLPLDIRSKLALEWKADLFVSLHVNSSPRSDAQGTETYILSQDATDAEARKLALLENSIAGQAREKESAVQDILWDVEQTGYLQDSAYLASYIQEAVVDFARKQMQEKKLGVAWKNRGVRQAPFFVLNRAAMPAVLVELGYLSNSRDRKFMTQKNFLDNLAKGIAAGVKKYRDTCSARSSG